MPFQTELMEAVQGCVRVGSRKINVCPAESGKPRLAISKSQDHQLSTSNILLIFDVTDHLAVCSKVETS
jgi:hypothetical protein